MFLFHPLVRHFLITLVVVAANMTWAASPAQLVVWLSQKPSTTTLADAHATVWASALSLNQAHDFLAAIDNARQTDTFRVYTSQQVFVQSLTTIATALSDRRYKNFSSVADFSTQEILREFHITESDFPIQLATLKIMPQLLGSKALITINGVNLSQHFKIWMSEGSLKNLIDRLNAFTATHQELPRSNGHARGENYLYKWLYKFMVNVDKGAWHQALTSTTRMLIEETDEQRKLRHFEKFIFDTKTLPRSNRKNPLPKERSAHEWLKENILGKAAADWPKGLSTEIVAILKMALGENSRPSPGRRNEHAVDKDLTPVERLNKYVATYGRLPMQNQGKSEGDLAEVSLFHWTYQNIRRVDAATWPKDLAPETLRLLQQSEAERFVHNLSVFAERLGRLTRNETAVSPKLYARLNKLFGAIPETLWPASLSPRARELITAEFARVAIDAAAAEASAAATGQAREQAASRRVAERVNALNEFVERESRGPRHSVAASSESSLHFWVRNHLFTTGAATWPSSMSPKARDAVWAMMSKDGTLKQFVAINLHVQTHSELPERGPLARWISEHPDALQNEMAKRWLTPLVRQRLGENAVERGLRQFKAFVQIHGIVARSSASSELPNESRSRRWFNEHIRGRAPAEWPSGMGTEFREQLISLLDINYRPRVGRPRAHDCGEIAKKAARPNKKW